jgi:hypothetical protein
MACDPERSDSAFAADLEECGGILSLPPGSLSPGEGVFPRRRGGELGFFAVVHSAVPRIIYQS